MQTVFIGGGTPSLFSAAAIERLLRGVAADLTLVRDAEITLEANPGAVDAARFAAFRAAGVNRLSIGIQSLRDDQLRALGRVHDSREARRAVRARADGGLHEHQSRLHVRVARRRRGRRVGRSRGGRRARAGASVVVPAHARAEHRVRAPPAAAARGRRPWPRSSRAAGNCSPRRASLVTRFRRIRDRARSAHTT